MGNERNEELIPTIPILEEYERTHYGYGRYGNGFSSSKKPFNPYWGRNFSTPHYLGQSLK